MGWDVLSTLAGALGAGLIAVAFWWSATQRAGKVQPPLQKLTAGWRLRELRDPVLVAHDVLDVDVPEGLTIYASGIVSPDILASCTVHQVAEVRTCFALERGGDKALMFTAGVHEGALALLTDQPELVGRLRTEWQTLESRAADYVERLPVGALAGKAGVTVETQGLVQDVLPYQDGFMMRLEDQGAIIGVLVGKDPETLRDERVLVRGRVAKQESGYLVLHADDVRRMR